MKNLDYIKVFEAGKYPQGDFTETDISEIASSYDTNYHEAPLTKDHQQTGEALGWIESVKASGKDLLVRFKDLTDDAIKLNREGKYKRPSVEIATYNGKKYLRAVSLTNFPAVKGLPALQFNEGANYYFSENILINFNDNKMYELIKEFAEKIGINISDYGTEGDILAKAEAIITELKTNFSQSQATIDSLNLSISKFDESGVTVEKFNELESKLKAAENKITEFEEKAISSEVESAISSKKFLPTQKDFLTKMAKADIDGFRTFVENAPELAVFSAPKVTGKTADGKLITYEMILKDGKLAAQFSESELETLRNQYLEGK